MRPLPYRAVGVLDGDKDGSEGCISLPGLRAPERLVFEELKAKSWPDLPARFGLGAGSLLGHLDNAVLTPDHHAWTSLVADRVLNSKNSVWEILANQWVKSCPDDGIAK